MFKTPPITKNLIIINVIMFLAAMVLRNYGIDLDSALGLHFFKADDFALYQLVTYMFMHGGWSHIFFNMFALWMFGRTMESVWGPRKFFAFYMLCGIGAGLTQEIWQLGEYYVEGLANYEYVNTGAAMIPMGDYLNMWTTIGASGACYAVLLAFGMTFPNETLIIFPIPIPLKAKYFVVVVAAIELFSSFATNWAAWCSATSSYATGAGREQGAAASRAGRTTTRRATDSSNACATNSTKPCKTATSAPTTHTCAATTTGVTTTNTTKGKTKNNKKSTGY